MPFSAAGRSVSSLKQLDRWLPPSIMQGTRLPAPFPFRLRAPDVWGLIEVRAAGYAGDDHDGTKEANR